MLADKTLLAVTLATTFTAGIFVGVAAKGPNRAAIAPPTDAATLCAPQLHELELQGYDAEEMGEARQAYTDWLKKYQDWWVEFLDLHAANCDQVDKRLDQRLSALKAKHAQRVGVR